jgi:hypothetical protein
MRAVSQPCAVRSARTRVRRVRTEDTMQPSVSDRIARIRELCAILEAARPDDLAAITLHAEALSHEAGLLAADAAEAVSRARRDNLRLTKPPLRPDDTGGSSQ